MSITLVPEIRDNYTLYKKLLKGRKNISSPIINIPNSRLSNYNFLVASEPLHHTALKDEIIFLTHLKKNDYKYFLFRLKCKSLCNIPFFKFDSDGGTKRTYDEDVPLEYQQVLTPHFSYYDKNGVLIPYQTNKLKDPTKKHELLDIHNCIKHFFDESNIRYNKDEYPSITILPGNLQFQFIDEDPNAGVRFA